MSRRAKNVCFYSKRCPHSKSFLEELAKTSFTPEFQFVCVDPAPNRPSLPTWLTSVPTLLIDGETDPLTDEKVFNWLAMRRIQDNSPASRNSISYSEPPKQQVSSRNDVPRNGPPVYDASPPPQQARRGQPPEPVQTRSSPNQASKEVAVPAAEGEPAWNSNEIGGTGKWSDAYSFIEDEFSIEKGTGGSRFERNFSLLDDGTPAGGPPATPAQQSEKAKALNSAFDTFRKQRDQDLPAPGPRR
jgi:hypothetical protein